MPSLSQDTSPEAERFQIGLLRQATPARRFSAARSLTALTIALALKAIRDTMPGEPDEHRVLARFVAIHHGEELASALLRHLARRAG